MSIKTPNDYIELFDNLYNRYTNELDNLSNLYISYKLYPTNTEYLINYENNINNLVKLESDILIKKNNLETNNKNIKNIINKINNMINKVTNENIKLSRKLTTLENQDYAFEGELIDKNYIYNKKLVKNIILLITICSSCSYIIFNKNKLKSNL